jgi:hypothetical protein
MLIGKGIREGDSPKSGVFGRSAGVRDESSSQLLRPGRSQDTIAACVLYDQSDGSSLRETRKTGRSFLLAQKPWREIGNEVVTAFSECETQQILNQIALLATREPEGEAGVVMINHGIQCSKTPIVQKPPLTCVKSAPKR